MKFPSRPVLLAAALVSVPAFAQPVTSLHDGTITRTETVKYKASEASTVDGATELYAKLHDAARRVCTEGETFASSSAGVAPCVADALENAVRRVLIPMVTVMHLQARRPATVAAR